MDYENLLYETAERITTITINRPKSLNALNEKTLEELAHGLARAKDDPVTKVIMITGAGEKAFVAGADLNELASLNPISGRNLAEKGQALFSFLEHIGKPSIAVVNGFALGGGAELALACTLRVASTNARFGLPEVGLGVLPGYGGTQRLPRLVGKGKALEIILSGEVIDAQEAYRIGLVNKIFLKESLMEEAKTFAQKLTQKGGMALRFAMEAVNQGLEVSFEKGLAIEACLGGLAWATEDAREGTRAFLEKRKPVFKDR